MLEHRANLDKTSDTLTTMAPSICKECGCLCDACGNVYLDLHQQIAELHSQLQKNSNHIANVEEQLRENKIGTDLELNKSKEEMYRLRERYDRLLESHKKMQKINHDLEDKLLRMVGRFESEKIALQHELSTMMNRLVDARTLITHLDEENEKYKQDCNMAVQLLQCKPSNFVAHKLNTLPLDLQDRVKHLMPRDQLIAVENVAAQPEEQRLIRIPIATFPPTAMVYSLQPNVKKEPLAANAYNSNGDTNHLSGYVPTSLIAKVLSQSSPRRSFPRSYLCMSCKQDVHVLDKGCQVDLLNRRTRPVEITSLSNVEKGIGVHSPRGSIGHSDSYMSSSSDSEHPRYNSFSQSPNGHKGLPQVQSSFGVLPHREKCLSTSSTDTVDL